jgi:hypothetical protein
MEKTIGKRREKTWEGWLGVMRDSREWRVGEREENRR